MQTRFTDAALASARHDEPLKLSCEQSGHDLLGSIAEVRKMNETEQYAVLGLAMYSDYQMMFAG